MLHLIANHLDEWCKPGCRYKQCFDWQAILRYMKYCIITVVLHQGAHSLSTGELFINNQVKKDPHAI